MPAVNTRRLALPARSFLLFGPRDTAKTSWLRAGLPRARRYNLLREVEFLRLMREPDLFRREVEALRAGYWIFVNEVQSLPSLLRELTN